IQQQVQGVVTDEKGEMLVGVSVAIKGTTTGTVTNSSGGFSIKVKPNEVLVFSYIGFLSQEIPYTNQSSLKVMLQEDVTAMDAVVVVGYGTQKKINLTGSVAVVDGEELESRPVVNATQSLQGLVPGLNVNVAGNTKPGQSFNLNVRGMGNLSGTDNPYVLVDG